LAWPLQLSKTGKEGTLLIQKFKQIKTISRKVLQAEIDRGRVDKMMIPYLLQLNDLPFVCTLNCCIGHMNDKQRVYGEKYNPDDKISRLYDGPFVRFITLLKRGLLLHVLNSHPQHGNNFIWEETENNITGIIFCIRLSFNNWEKNLQYLIDELGFFQKSLKS
jgi:hypothetical protein